MVEQAPGTEEQLSPITSKSPAPEVRAAYTSGVNKSLIVVLVVLVVLALGVAGFMWWQNKQLAAQIELMTTSQQAAKPTEVVPSVTKTPQPAEAVEKPSQTNTFKIPSNWPSYTDEAAGITINYPPEMNPKLNSNRGAASNYKAGSYIVDAVMGDVLDFYFYEYPGGSRREAFYQAVQFDGPENASKYTQSATDVSLNGKTYLKITTTYTSEPGGRVFYLIPQGNRLYYFTLAKNIEKNTALFKNLQMIIASATFNANSQAFLSPSDKQYVSCQATKDFLKEKGDTWDARLDSSGDLVIIQRLTQVLKTKVIRKERVEVTSNIQTYTAPNWEITNFAIMVDSDQKGNYQDAIVLTIPKVEVDKISAATPKSIPSISAAMKINDSLESVSGVWCRPYSAAGIYFTNG